MAIIYNGKGMPTTSPNDDRAMYTVGDTWTDQATGKVFEYVEVDAASAAVAAGTVLYRNTDNEVTTVYSVTAANMPAGVGVSTIGVGNFGFIQVWGNHTAILTTSASLASSGNPLIANSGTDGTCKAYYTIASAGLAVPSFATIAIATEDKATAGVTSIAGFIVTRAR